MSEKTVKTSSKQSNKKTLRSRNWVALAYPESAEPTWIEDLAAYGNPMLVSPLHEHDVHDDGTPKKAHYHVIISFQNARTYSSVKKLMSTVGLVMPPEREAYVRSFKKAARYLCHLEDADKYRYDIDDVLEFNGANYKAAIQSDAVDEVVLNEIYAFIDANNIISYSSFVRWARHNRPDWLRVIHSNKNRWISSYIKANYFEITHGEEVFRIQKTEFVLPEDLEKTVHDDNEM